MWTIIAVIAIGAANLFGGILLGSLIPFARVRGELGRLADRIDGEH